LEVEKATNAAFQTWEDVSCAYPDFVYLGQTTTNAAIDPSNVGDPTDAFNVSTVWVTNTSDPYYTSALAGGQSPATAVPLTYAGYLYQCDIFVNAVNFHWTTLPDTPASENLTDLQTALEHEIGHCLGLADVSDPTEAVMNPELPVGGNRRALDPQDSQQLCDYYPENGAVGSPCSVSDPCSNGLTCIPYKNSSGTTLYQYCSKGCNGLTNGECPSPFACRDSSAISGYSKACQAVPGEAITQVGKPCNMDSECGGPNSICQTPSALPSTGTAWVDGYCSENCVAGSSAVTCPSGSVCVELGTPDRCFKQCRPGSGDCRAGYTCAPLAEGNVCIPNCYTDEDCNTGGGPVGYTCRTCDRVCIENKQTGLSVGSPCTTSEQCGAGQFCFFIGTQTQGVCTQTCNTAACGCPLGSTCKPVGEDRVCMKDCAAGTCAAPLQCNPVGQTYSCTAACRTSADCPTGFECYGGTCQDPNNRPDAGCTLCSDGGTPPPPPPPTDGGTGGGSAGPGGCGCSGAPASALVIFGLLALLFGGRRRSWPRQ
jgi:uncharacterized protein (TIGR03382 family)